MGLPAVSVAVGVTWWWWWWRGGGGGRVPDSKCVREDETTVSLSVVSVFIIIKILRFSVG
jgi:hypothetical protein